MHACTPVCTVQNKLCIQVTFNIPFSRSNWQKYTDNKTLVGICATMLKHLCTPLGLASGSTVSCQCDEYGVALLLSLSSSHAPSLLVPSVSKLNT